jgi:hypothetical protein
MNGVTWITFLALIGGLLVHTLKDYGAARQNGVQLRPADYFAGAWFETVSATVCAIVLWVGLPEIAATFPDIAKTAGIGEKQSVLASFIVGYMSNSLVGVLGNRAKLVTGLKMVPIFLAAGLALAMPRTAAASDSVPPCYDVPEHIVKLDAPTSAGDTHAVSWRCGNQVVIDVGKPSDVTAFVTKWIAGTFSKAEADAARASLPKTPEAEFAPIKRRVLVDYYGQQPRTLGTVGYKRRITIDRDTTVGSYTYVAFAAIPKDFICTRAGKAGEYMPVPISRTLVQKLSEFDSFPDIIYAPCG